MTKSHLSQAVAAFAAAVTTLMVFSSVASPADDDKAALVAAKSVRGTQVVQATPSVQK